MNDDSILVVGKVPVAVGHTIKKLDLIIDSFYFSIVVRISKRIFNKRKMLT